MSASYRGTRPRAVDAKGPKKSPFSPLHTPPVWPFCAADGTIRTALALPLREASSFSSEPPQARTATRSLARTTHLPDLPASCWLRLPHPYSITSAAPLALTYLKWPVEQLSHWPVTGPALIFAWAVGQRGDNAVLKAKTKLKVKTAEACLRSPNAALLDSSYDQGPQSNVGLCVRQRF